MAQPVIPLMTTAAPEDTDTRLECLEQAHQAILKEYPKMHSMLIVRHGKLIFERYYNDHHAGALNDLRSATKSFVSVLTGIAIGRGEMPDLHISVSEVLRKHIPYLHSPHLSKITLRHLLTMTSGFSWITGKKLGEPLVRNLHRSRRWGSFGLSLNIIPEQIGQFQYRSIDSHLISIMISESTGLDAFPYAAQHLFTPLRMANTAWLPSPEGHSMGHIGLHLTSRDMAKFGICLLNNGVFAEQQIIPEHWLQDALTAQAKGYPAFGDYGYQFWIGTMSGQPYKLAHGHGGQQILLFPNLDAVVVFTAESKTNNWKNPRRLLEKYVLPSMS
ncbi:serine hydrolase domain-containing protein [Paenibacillus odorifer]|uniref:serine hydrolase domain-containing protein n=1 Tax=Paenibacillus odorifer TaxID=189426 RepID=UPI00096CE444|nr:serine hydrolase [Paenibacillus odorifer]OMD57378.1 serine hydrolase [Paenibacillus odorifer]